MVVENMLPEVAYVKAMWVLAHAKTREEVVRLFTTPLAGEMAPRTDVEPYPRPGYVEDA